MNDSRASLATALIGLIGLVGMRPVASDPASSAASAWSPLPPQPESSLTDPVERRGQAVFEERCAACHGPIPEEIFGPAFLPVMPGTQALRARYRGELPAALEERRDLAPELVRTVVRRGLPAMPFFRPTEVSDEDLEAVAAYLTRSR
jgi:mono/diheme cytochrome c family protein